MSHPLEREFEALCTIIEFLDASEDREENKWLTVSVLAVIEILNDYWELIENGEEDEDLPGKAIDSIYEVLHLTLVHREIPMTEEQRIAAEDQEIAAFRDQLEGLGEKTGIPIKLIDFDEFLKGKKEKGDDEQE